MCTVNSQKRKLCHRIEAHARKEDHEGLLRKLIAGVWKSSSENDDYIHVRPGCSRFVKSAVSTPPRWSSSEVSVIYNKGKRRMHLFTWFLNICASTDDELVWRSSMSSKNRVRAIERQ